MPSKTLSELKAELVLNEADYLRAAREAVAKGAECQSVVDACHAAGVRTLLFIGAGGTWVMSNWFVDLAQQNGSMAVHSLIAADFVEMGHPQLDASAMIVVSSVTGNTQEVVRAVEVAKEAGARVVSLVPDADTPLAQMADHHIQIVEDWRGFDIYQLVIATRLLHLDGKFPEYNSLFAALDRLPEAMLDVVRSVEPAAAKFALDHKDSDYVFLVGSGYLWGLTYSYSMCVLEESFWIRTSRVSGPEFFHGALELVERDTPMLIMQGEDYGRPLTDRVIRFAQQYSDDVSVFDTADYVLEGVPDALRPLFGNLVQNHAFRRITMNLQVTRAHDSYDRRYYRKVSY